MKCDKHWNYFQLHINPYLPQPMAGRGLSDMLVSQLSSHGIAADVRRVKADLVASNTYNTTSAVITAFAKLLGELHDPQAAINAVAAAVYDNPVGKRLRSGERLPNGQLCSFGSCNMAHGDRACWSSCKFTGKIPYRI